MHEITQANKCDKAFKCIGVRIISLFIIASLVRSSSSSCSWYKDKDNGNKGSQPLNFRFVVIRRAVNR